MEQVTGAVDWSGGTRIGESLSDFNRLWSRAYWDKALSSSLFRMV